MCAQWAKTYDQNFLASRLNSLKSIVTAKSVPVGEYVKVADVKTILTTAIKLAPEISEVDRDQVIDAGVRRAAGQRRISAKSLKDSIEKEERAFLRKPFLPYVVLSTWSAVTTRLSTKIGGVTITSQPRLSKKFTRARKDSEEKARDILYYRVPQSWEYIRIPVLSGESRAIGR